MKSSLVRRKYIEFFEGLHHVAIPSAPLVPENDPTTLFNSSGMQPLIPYLLGQPHPSGKRLVNSQKSIRTQDIEEVGDNRHTTFFEMLGNWSLGDYFKKEQLSWVFQFLTQEIGLDPKRLYVSVYEGGSGISKDDTSIDLWKELFASVQIEALENTRIFTYPARKNWWSRSGEPDKMPVGEPGGPDSEIFFDFGEKRGFHEQSEWKDEPCHPNCDCGRFMEIGNSVFMQYQKQEDGSLKELLQKNVDFGGGLERIVAASLDNPDVFEIDVFKPLITQLSAFAKVEYGKNLEIDKRMRIIADHVRASAFLIKDGVVPSNKLQGYILRKLIRRAALKLKELSSTTELSLIHSLTAKIVGLYEGSGYFDYKDKHDEVWIADCVYEEIKKFEKSLDKGLREIEKYKELNGTNAFVLYETYGFPWEMSAEIATTRGQNIDRQEFETEFKKHQDLSRTAAAGMFKGGLADQSVETTRLHTAHHLLLSALQSIVDPNIKQKGSNITAERLRIDVNLDRKLTPDELQKIEVMVNEKIAEGLPVVRVDMNKQDAEKIGAQMEFGKKYPDRVSVYFIGSEKDHFSAEFCGGPHVTNTKEIGEGGKKFRLVKDENIGSGLRRFKAVLE